MLIRLGNDGLNHCDGSMLRKELLVKLRKSRLEENSLEEERKIMELCKNSCATCEHPNGRETRRWCKSGVEILTPYVCVFSHNYVTWQIAMNKILKNLIDQCFSKDLYHQSNKTHQLIIVAIFHARTFGDDIEMTTLVYNACTNYTNWDMFDF